MTIKKFLTTSVTSLGMFFTGCGNGMSKNATEFEWHATDSGHFGYPEEVLSW